MIVFVPLGILLAGIIFAVHVIYYVTMVPFVMIYRYMQGLDPVPPYVRTQMMWIRRHVFCCCRCDNNNNTTQRSNLSEDTTSVRRDKPATTTTAAADVHLDLEQQFQEQEQ